MAKDIQETTGIQTRATILGHLQRGGNPTALDRMHASIMGYKAVQALMAGERTRVVVYNQGQYGTMDIEEALTMQKRYDAELYDIVKTLAVSK